MATIKTKIAPGTKKRKTILAVFTFLHRFFHHLDHFIYLSHVFLRNPVDLVRPSIFLPYEGRVHVKALEIYIFVPSLLRISPVTVGPGGGIAVLTQLGRIVEISEEKFFFDMGMLKERFVRVCS